MKIRALLAAVAFTIVPISATGQFVDNDTSDSGLGLSTVAEIKEAAKLDSGGGGFGGLIDMAITAGKMDERAFTLEGRITARIDGNKYVFEDDTGRMAVEIDRRDFAGQKVTPKSKIRITGEAEYSELGIGIEVYSLEVALTDETFDLSGALTS